MAKKTHVTRPGRKGVKKTISTHHILKKHFPTFYEKPVFGVIILLILIATFWLLR